MKVKRPIYSRRLAVLGLASAIALGTSAIPASAATPTSPAPFVPIPYPNVVNDLTVAKSTDKQSPSILSGAHGTQLKAIGSALERLARRG